MTQAAFLSPSDAMVSTHAGSIAGERFQVLDSWRGICALLVALFHFPTASAISRSAFIGSCYLFVDFLFVLSGFVIASSYADRLSQPAEVVFIAGPPAWIWLVAAAVTAPLLLLGFSTHHMMSYDFGFISCLCDFSLGALLAWFQHDSIAGARQFLARSGRRLGWNLAEIVMVAGHRAFHVIGGQQ